MLPNKTPSDLPRNVAIVPQWFWLYHLVTGTRDVISTWLSLVQNL